MHREIEKFILDCKKKMEKIGWTYKDLAKASGMHEGSFNRILGPRKLKPSPETIKKIAKVLGVEAPNLEEFTTGGFGVLLKEDAQKLSLSNIEERLQKAMNSFRLGVKELEEIDRDAEKVIKEIAERMRATSMLKESLDVFRKH